MCTNRALTDLYAFSARFIQLLNRKLAYVCIADYYKSEQNVLLFNFNNNIYEEAFL